jgi:hypothetical protein
MCLSFAVETVLTWRFFFIGPMVFLDRDYRLFDCGSVALRETKPKLAE